MILRVCNPWKAALNVPLFRLFSSEKGQETTKVETVGFKNNTVRDFNKIAFEPKTPLSFNNGKCLIYQYKRTWAQILLRSSFYYIPLAGIADLIYLNPWADVFPASIPIMTVLELFIMKLWLNKMRKNQNIVSHIYLLENGQATQIHFSNQQKRKLFGEPLKKIYYNSVFVTPDYEKEGILVLDEKNQSFPESMESISMNGYCWTKHFSNGQNYFLLPKKGDMNLQVLIQIFKGKQIKSPKE